MMAVLLTIASWRTVSYLKVQWQCNSKKPTAEVGCNRFIAPGQGHRGSEGRYSGCGCNRSNLCFCYCI